MHMKLFHVSETLLWSEPTGCCRGVTVQVIKKGKFSLKDATAFQALASNWNQEQGQDRKQKLRGCMSVSLVGFQFLKRCQLVESVVVLDYFLPYISKVH